MRITSQMLTEFGLLTEYLDGSFELLPYLVDENGEEYVDLDPNRDIWPVRNVSPVVAAMSGRFRYVVEWSTPNCVLRQPWDTIKEARAYIRKLPAGATWEIVREVMQRQIVDRSSPPKES